MLFKHLLFFSVTILLGTVVADPPYEVHCLRYSIDLQRCLTCETEFLLSPEGTCVKCNNPDSKCISCSHQSQSCTQCERGYYIQKQNPQNECQQCPVNCNECDSYSQCLECTTGFVLYYGICLECIDNCKACKSHKECLECNPKFILSVDAKRCEPCPDNCLSCNIYRYCITCEDHYYILNGLCVPTLD